MTPSRSYLSVFTDGYLTSKQVSLGRLVLNMKNPGQDFCPYSPILTDQDVAPVPFHHVKELINYDSSSEFRFKLTKLFSILVGKSITSFDNIHSETAITYQLLNSESWFEQMCAEEDVKKWLERFLQRGSVSMVVGLHTVKDASVGVDRQATTKIEGEGTIPLNEVALPGSSMAPGLGSPLDMKMKVSNANNIQTSASFVAPNERIIAIQYRKIEFKPFSSKTADKAFLAKNSCWKFFGVGRGDGINDAVDAELQQHTGHNDFKRLRVDALYRTTDEKETFAFLA
jgi:hypothetical protein